MKKYFTIFIVLTLPFFAQNVSKVYVLSEGGFSPGTSMLSMLNLGNNGFSQNIFAPGNIGLYPDGLMIHEDHIYLTVQGSFGGNGKIYKLDTLGNVLASAVVGTNPYSAAASNGKVYLTNGPASSVSVLNIGDLSLVTNIPVGVYPQEIISFGNRIYVANTSLFGGAEDSTVSVIDASTDQVISIINVRKDPSSLAISSDDHLLIGCPGDGTNAMIYKVNVSSNTKVDSFMIPGFGFGKDLFADKNNDKIYFISSTNAIAELDLSSRSAKEIVNDPAVLFTYGYSYDFVNQIHYLADAKNFMSNGSLNVYDNMGSKIGAYETGMAPRRVLIKYNYPSTAVIDEPMNYNFNLAQNYPNPFNPSTKIGIVIPSEVEGPSTLKVYDLLGKEVATLLNKQMQSGTYEVEFDASNLPSGVYFYKFSAGSFIETKKMMLVR